MTGSEHTSTSCTNSKPSQQGKELQRDENCEQLTETSSTTSPSSSLLKRDKSLGSSSNSSNPILASSPSTLKSYSDFSAHDTKESMGKEPGLCRTAGTNRSMSHPKMKRTISNCLVRNHNASTLCSQDSSYVYHYPSNVARKNNQQQQHKSILPSSTPSSLVTATNLFDLPLCEDNASDETQSMVDLGCRPSRMQTQHRASVRREREGNETSHMRTTHSAAGRDHLQHSSHQIYDKLLISKRHLDCTHPQASSHIALGKTCGGDLASGEQKQLFHNDYHHKQPHIHTLHQLTNHHQMTSHIDLSRGRSYSSKPHSQEIHRSSNICRMNGGIAQASTGQVPRHHTLRSLSVSSVRDKRIILHVPSGRKRESLI